MTQTQPYQRPPMPTRQALAIAKYALLAAIDQDRAEGPTAAITDLIEAVQTIEGLKQAYARPEGEQCQT